MIPTETSSLQEAGQRTKVGNVMAILKYFREHENTAQETDPGMDIEKMKNMILFFLEHARGETLGKVKLMKLLYYADFDHYDDYREPISNATYTRIQNGPVALAAMDLLKEMERDGEIEAYKERVIDFDRQCYRPLKEFDPSLFSQKEIDTLMAEVERWRHATTSAIVAASHNDPPWAASAHSDQIPYELVLYRNTHGDMDLDDDEIWG